jgi:dTMP kinase
MESTRRGKLIVIDGTDGAGKKTQTKRVSDLMRSLGHTVVTFAFPQYGNPSAKDVERYLAGEFGNPTEVDPRKASLFYAADRLNLADTIRATLAAGKHVLLDRYVDANAGHQGGKIADREEREEFYRWLYDKEYKELGIPVPDINVILHVPAELGQKRAQEKQLTEGIRADGHEADIEHLRKAEHSYLTLVHMFPDDHVLIRCAEDGVQFPEEVITKKIWEHLQKVLV